MWTLIGFVQESTLSGPKETGTNALGFTVELWFPDLYPQAVMYALFDTDQTHSFRANLIKKGGWDRPGPTGSPAASSRLMAAWDQIFDAVAASRVFLAVPRNTPSAVQDPSPVQTKVETSSGGIWIFSSRPLSRNTRWIVSRAYRHRDRTLAWCVPLELKKGTHPFVILSKDNAKLLHSLV
jgi:hypothetical protein